MKLEKPYRAQREKIMEQQSKTWGYWFENCETKLSE